ncbi:MAG: A/G-specific DNA-adenine glycosylase [Firmicutes bacterium]|nr:A/G-specific DNA-adenine glycosylase [Bacillota bacterium]
MNLSCNSSKNNAHDQSLSTRLLTWYTAVQRDLPWRKTRDPYAIWVSEVMLQQTQVKTVIPYFERFLKRFPSVEHLGTASLDDVLTIWSGLGYYSRARRMWEGANYLIEKLDGKMPSNYEALLQIPGIGDYTAGAIASIAFGQRVPAIDGNVKRVLSRLLAWPEPVETARSYRCFRDNLMAWQSVLKPGDFNQALMELGAMVCSPRNPKCKCCPLADVCKGYLQGDFLGYPVKKLKAQRQEVTRLTFVLRQGNQVYLQKRPARGLLADLWEFPGVELSDSDIHRAKDSLPVITQHKCFDHFQQAVSERAFDAQVKDLLEQEIDYHGPVWYTFSHRRWKIVWAIIDLPQNTVKRTSASLKEKDGEYITEPGEEKKRAKCRWVSLNDLSLIPLPRAFMSIVEILTPYEE